MTKPYHHGDLREKLLKAGEQALEELPLEAVSLREIARRAGVSHAAPKHHFASMGDMLGEIAARGFEKFVEALAIATAQASPQTPDARMMAMGWAYLRFAENHAAVYALMFGKLDRMAMTPNMVKHSMAAWAQLENAVAAITGHAHAPTGALHVWSTVHGLAMLKAQRRLPFHMPVHAAEENTLRMMIAGLKSQ
jgi:AcrR family transcriptional regulator